MKTTPVHLWYSPVSDTWTIYDSKTGHVVYSASNTVYDEILDWLERNPRYQMEPFHKRRNRR